MKGYLLFLCTVISSLSAHAFNWIDLWSTPDQQGQNLMANNQFKQAQEVFARADWAATAAYRAGDYPKANQLYRELKNELGYYNQANALAHMGKYQEAIKAYDQALAINPLNQDARYNRQLIEKLLKKNKDQQAEDQHNKDKQDPDQQNRDQQNKGQQDKGQQDKGQQDKGQQDKDQQNTDQPDRTQKNIDPKNKDQQSKGQHKGQPNKDQFEQKNNQNDNKVPEGKLERQKAKEQWLRLIPDDPGGLMREKFLREHLRRERERYK